MSPALASRVIDSGFMIFSPQGPVYSCRLHMALVSAFKAYLPTTRDKISVSRTLWHGRDGSRPTKKYITRS